MVGIECRNVGRTAGRGRHGGTHDRFVQATHSARAGCPVPDVVSSIRIGVTPAYETGTMQRLGRKYRIESEQPVTSGVLEVRVYRHRFDFGPASQAVAGIVSYLEMIENPGTAAERGRDAVATVVSQVVVIAGDR